VGGLKFWKVNVITISSNSCVSGIAISGPLAVGQTTAPIAFDTHKFGGRQGLGSFEQTQVQLGELEAEDR